MKLNKKGFAISTMLYGVVFVAIAVFYTIIAIVSNRSTNNDNFVDDARQTIENLRFHGAVLQCSNRVYNGRSQSVARVSKANFTTAYEYTMVGNYQVSATAFPGYKFADNTTTKTITCPINQASPIISFQQLSTPSAYAGNGVRVMIRVITSVDCRITTASGEIITTTRANTTATISESFTCPSLLTSTTHRSSTVRYTVIPTNNTNYKEENIALTLTYTCRAR